MTGNGDDHSYSSEGKKSGKRRKKTSRRKMVKRPKNTGQSQRKSTEPTSPSISGSERDESEDLESAAVPVPEIFDEDLAECMFSDDEERTVFLCDAKASCGHSLCQHDNDGHYELLNVESCSEVDIECEAVSQFTSLSSHQLSVHSSTATPEPHSGLSSRCSSSLNENSSEVLEHDEPFNFAVPVEPLSTSAPQSVSFELSGECRSPSSSSQHMSSPVTQMPEVHENLSSSNDEIGNSPPLPLITLGLSKLMELVESPWISIADREGFHLLLMSDGLFKTVQRSVFISFSGEVRILVHCTRLPFERSLLDTVTVPQVRFDQSTVDEFCKRAHNIVQTVMQYKVCIGGNHMETQEKWENIPETYIDSNPYFEESYEKTCRSLSCCKLIKHGRNLRCDSCQKVLKSLKKREKSLLSDTHHPNTPNVHLTREQLFHKVNAQCEDIKRKNSRIAYLIGKIAQLLDKEGVDIDSDLSNDLSSILANANLTDVQKMFLREQLLCSGKKNPRSHRWHPSMIRFALHLKMQSSSAYNALRESELIKLPCNRTLYDYSHAFAPQAGVSTGMLKIAVKKISSMKKPHQKYVALIFDEMYISKNLVYRQSDGNLVGFVHLNQVEKEMMQFDNFLCGKECDLQLPLATKILAYMVKGLTSKLKCVIASYPVSQLTKDMVYQRTWEVISRLERAGIKVLCAVCDGSSVNRSFIDMHTPFTKLLSGVIFDTVNWCSSDGRILYFISDVAHLIKTIRNCFYNSGEGPKKTRCLFYNGEKIEWKTIVRLYLTYKQCSFRKSFKLNSQNVFPNSYSCMSVKHAVTVPSETVATDVELQKWKDTTETVNFLRRWNKFFDCLNGLHSGEHIEKRNPNLAPYKNAKDSRYDWLLSIIDHLEEWRKQAMALGGTPKDRERRMLSSQTQHGIEMTIRGFSGASKFLLEQGADFIMPRDFSQDHLENYFSRQRGKGGGSSNPNANQFMSQQVAMGIQSELEIYKRGANVQGRSGMSVSEEPVPKREKRRKVK